MTKKAKEQAARMTREEVEAAVKTMCIESVLIDQRTASLNEDLAHARDLHGPHIQRSQETYAEAEARVRAWAESHPAEFATKKSVAFVHGTIGFRTGQPTLKTLSGVTWAKVLALLKACLPGYVRTKEEPDRETLLADREALGPDGLRAVGLRVDQAERFFVEVKKESVLEAVVGRGEEAPAGARRKP